MGEPWGPPKRRLTKLDEWVGAWPADIANHYIHADWYGPSPIYTQDNFSVITGHVGPGGALSTEMVEASAADILTQAENTADFIRYNRLMFGVAGPATQADENQRRYGVLGAMTLAGGVLNNHVLSIADGAWYQCIEIIGLWSDTTDTYTLSFQDEDDVACVGVPAALDVACTAGQVTPLYGIAMHCATDDDDLEVDVAGGAGIEELHLLYVEWAESDAMILRIVISKEYTNEANMRSQRDAVEALAAEKGFKFHWTVSE